MENRKAQVAASLARPSIGASGLTVPGLRGNSERLISEHGVRWLVRDQLVAGTLGTLARRHRNVQAWDDSQDRYDVIELRDVSSRLVNFMAETDRCTSKEIVLLDTEPESRPDMTHPGGHWVDALTSPDTILVFLDAARMHETIVAHEIAHVWIGVVEGCEDYRVPRDQADAATLFLWAAIQSLVLDNRVNELLTERGFDMSIVEADQVEGLRNFAQAASRGYRPPTLEEGAFVAGWLAGVMIDAADNPVLQTEIRQLLVVFEPRLPDIVRLGRSMAASVLKDGWHSASQVRSSVDACAALSYAYMERTFDPGRDLADAPTTEWNADKYPEYFPGWPVPIKLEIAKTMARERIPPGRECKLSTASDGLIRAQFELPGGAWSRQIVLQNVAISGTPGPLSALPILSPPAAPNPGTHHPLLR